MLAVLALIAAVRQWDVWKSLTPWEAVFCGSLFLLLILVIDQIRLAIKSVKSWGVALNGIREQGELADKNMVAMFKSLAEDYHKLVVLQERKGQ